MCSISSRSWQTDAYLCKQAGVKSVQQEHAAAPVATDVATGEQTGLKTVDARAHLLCIAPDNAPTGELRHHIQQHVQSSKNPSGIVCLWCCRHESSCLSQSVYRLQLTHSVCIAGETLHFAHQVAAPSQCKAVTLLGPQCSRQATRASGLCWQHDKMGDRVRLASVKLENDASKPVNDNRGA